MRRMTDGLKDSFTIYVEQVNGDIFQVSVYNDRLPQGTMFDQVSDAPLCIQIDKAARAIVAPFYAGAATHARGHDACPCRFARPRSVSSTRRRAWRSTPTA
jgi:hypothetical protein